tara:strand:- start:700 stop:846 length:147 start_codon:yes stop_codon:yes gene_type:complete
MVPDVLNHAVTESGQRGLWIPILGAIIVFLGLNMTVEIKIQNKEDDED